MNSYELVRFEMGRAVRDYLTSNAAVTADLVGYPAAFQALCDALDKVDQLVLTQAELVRAPIVDRNAKADVMIDATLHLAGAVLAVLDPATQGELAEKLRVTAGDFARARLSQRVMMARRISEVLRGALPLAGAPTLTVATVDALEDKIDAAEAALPTPRTLTVRKRAATQAMGTTVREMSDVLKSQLDRILRPLRLTQPEFYAGYKAARTVINRPGRHRSTEEEPAAAPAATTEVRVAA